jgi:hypothetical protein
MKTAALVLLLAFPAFCDVKPGDTAPALTCRRSFPVNPWTPPSHRSTAGKIPAKFVW